MRKKMSMFLYFGIIGFIGGIIMANLHGVPRVIAAVMISLSSALIAVVIAARGGFAISDEMVVRMESLSGNYTYITSLFFIFALSIVNHFFPLPMSIDGLLLVMMLFMSISFLLFRLVLLKRGKAE